MWTIDGSFHCIVMEGNVEVKKRVDSPEDIDQTWLVRGEDGEPWPLLPYCSTLQSPLDGYHRLDIIYIWTLLSSTTYHYLHI